LFVWTVGSSDTTDCFSPGANQPQICLRDREQNLFDNVMLNGVEVNWFYAPRFGRIKDRVQIGLNIGGGIAKFSGSVHRVEDRADPVFTPGPGGGSVRIVNRHEEETNPAEDELLRFSRCCKSSSWALSSRRRQSRSRSQAG
jgi:hypothetical protein